MGVMNLTIYVPLLLNMLHTKFGQDTHSSFIKDAENVEMLFAVRTAKTNIIGYSANLAILNLSRC